MIGFIIFVSWSLLQTEKAALQSLVHRRSSAIIASSLQNIRTIYLRDNIRCLKYEKQRCLVQSFPILPTVVHESAIYILYIS